MLPEVSTLTIQNAFKSLGLTEEYGKVYYASLILGPSGASSISKKSNLPRSSTYDVLNLLVKRGLMSVIEDSKSKTFSANTPEVVLNLLRNEKESINNNFNNFEKNIEEIQSLYFSNKANFPKVRFYEGESGLKTALYDCLNTKDIIYGICQGVENKLRTLKDEPKYVLDFLNELRIRKLRVNDLLEDNQANHEYKMKYESKYYQCKLIPQRSKTIDHVDKQIYDNKIAYISHDNKIAIIIEDETLASHEKVIFEDLWNFSNIVKI